ncbi:MAG: hypothetical protein ACMUIA_12470 [bacterium]
MGNGMVGTVAVTDGVGNVVIGVGIIIEVKGFGDGTGAGGIDGVGGNGVGTVVGVGTTAVIEGGVGTGMVTGAGGSGGGERVRNGQRERLGIAAVIEVGLGIVGQMLVIAGKGLVTAKFTATLEVRLTGAIKVAVRAFIRLIRGGEIMRLKGRTGRDGCKPARGIGGMNARGHRVIGLPKTKGFMILLTGRL